MKRIGLIGNLGSSNNCNDGQTVKTKIVLNGLIKIIGNEQVLYFNTFGGIKHLFKSVIITFSFLRKCNNVIILPAHNGIKIFAPLLAVLNRIYKRQLHYIVIGGWLPEFLISKPWLKKALLKFSFIYVETSTMKNKLEVMGFSNIIIMPNCKDLDILKEEDLPRTVSEPYKLCTLSRVIKQKGIEDAINAVNDLNKKYKRQVFSLDIFGPIDENYKDSFANIQLTFPPNIKYRGIVPFDKTVECLKNYYLLLFPTHYFTEGIPGTIIDSFAAGVPIIFSKWVNYKDLMQDGKDGIGYEFGNYNDFIEKIDYIIHQSELYKVMKINCLKRAEEFSTESVIKNLLAKHLA